MSSFALGSWLGWPLLALAPFGLCAWVRWRRRTEQALRDELGPRHTWLAGVPVPLRWRGTALGAAWLGAGLALLDPVWGEVPGEVAGADVVFCLDVSTSMLARDVVPDRLGAARAAIAALAEAAPGARFGLVVYAGSAELAAPLSADRHAVADLAATAALSSAGRGGSDPGAAIERAVQLLQRGKSRAGAVVVCSDGEDFVGNGAAAAARAQAAGAAVHALGCGRPIPCKVTVDTADGPQFLRDGAGQEVLTALVPDALAAVAAAGGGRVVPGTAMALQELYERVVRPAALAARRADPDHVAAHRFGWPLSVAVLAWMLFLCLPERRRRP